MNDRQLKEICRNVLRNRNVVAGGIDATRYQLGITKIFLRADESLTENERREIASALTRKSYNTGQVIVRQGDRGDDFYIVEEGELLCTAQKSPGKKLGTIFYCCVI